MATLSTSIFHNALSLRHLSTKRHGCSLHQLSLPIRINCYFASKCVSKFEESLSPFKELRTIACGLFAVCAVATTSPVIAINHGKSLAAALISDAKFEGADMSEAVMSKAYVVRASFQGNKSRSWFIQKKMTKSFASTNFSNAVLDRVNFEKANLQGVVFKKTILSGFTFDNAQLEDAVLKKQL